MEEAIQAEDSSRAAKAKERQDHYIVEKIKDANARDEEREGDSDPRKNEPKPVTESEVLAEKGQATGADRDASDAEMGENAPEEVLEDGPAGERETRVRPPQAPPMSRRDNLIDGPRRAKKCG